MVGIVPVLVLALLMQPAPDELMGWSEFLEWCVSSGGAPVVIGAIISVLLELWPWYLKLDKKAKTVSFFLLSLAVPAAITTLGVFTAGWEPSWELRYWPAMQAGGLAFVGGTLTHRFLPDVQRFVQQLFSRQ